MPDFADIALFCGAVAAVVLIPALLIGLQRPEQGVWPAPPAGSLRSFLFWSLFRTVNVALLAAALLRLFDAQSMSALQIIAMALSAAFGILYARTLWALGRKATYCQPSGLNTSGVYRWTRNPQYSAAIAAFTMLAAGVAAIDVAALAVAMIAIYVLMAHAEEPWLEARYGGSYDAYTQRVPRFFNWRLLVLTITSALRREAPRQPSRN